MSIKWISGVGWEYTPTPHCNAKKCQWKRLAHDDEFCYMFDEKQNRCAQFKSVDESLKKINEGFKKS